MNYKMKQDKMSAKTKLYTGILYVNVIKLKGFNIQNLLTKKNINIQK